MNIKYLLLSFVIFLFLSTPIYSREKPLDAHRDAIINNVVHFRPWREKRIFEISQLNPEDENEYCVFCYHYIEDEKEHWVTYYPDPDDIYTSIYTTADTLGPDIIQYQYIERFIFTPADTLGSDFIQYRFAEKDGRLFLWQDSTAVVTQELIDILEKYNCIEFVPRDRQWYLGENAIIDDGARVLEYWFCPMPSTKFTRRFLTPPFQRFFNNNRKDPPRLKCNCNP